ncbi:type II secretion system minor pseudopilin GspK [Orrella sp. JC864]|uniref:type II secretion system minor pseudopilin GspK n=1 Tax=Orrella sp. JC864 TaxID=3120298 RepID=UPI0012BBAA3E
MQHRQRPFVPGQQGMAAVAALLIVAVVSVMAAGILARQAARTDSAQAEQSRVQARWLLRGGLAWAQALLEREAQRDPATRLDGAWSQPVALRPGGRSRAQFGVYRGEIIDEQGKFNLRNLEWDGEVVVSEVEAFTRLCAMLGVPAASADAIMRRVLLAIASPQRAPRPDAQDPQTQARRQAEQQVRARLGLPASLPRPRAPFPRALEDLLAVEGVDAQVIARLKPYVTILPARTWLNANTTRAEVLAAWIPGYTLERARALLGQRDQGQWFVNRGDIMNRLQMPELRNERLPIGIQSNFFLVRGVVEHQGVVMIMAALLHDDKRTTPRVVWTREGA